MSRDMTSGNNLDLDQLNLISNDEEVNSGLYQEGHYRDIHRDQPNVAPHAFWSSPDEEYSSSQDDEESWTSTNEADGDGGPTDSASAGSRTRMHPRTRMYDRKPLQPGLHQSRTQRQPPSPRRVFPMPRHMSGGRATVEDASDTDLQNGSYAKTYDVRGRLSGGMKSMPGTMESPMPQNTLVLREKERDQQVDETSALREELERLRRENERMRELQGETSYTARPAQPATTYKTFYTIEETYFLDEPHWEPGDSMTTVLRASNPIRNFTDYLDQHPDIAFAIIKDYYPKPPRDRSKIEGKDGVYRKPEPFSEYLLLISDPMVEAADDLMHLVPRFKMLFPNFNPRRAIEAPYLFMFHSAPYLPDIEPDLDPISNQLLGKLDECIRQSHGFDYDSAKSLAKKGCVSNDLFAYLIKPGDVLVKLDGPQTQAYLAVDWARETDDSKQERKDDFRLDDLNAQSGAPTKGWDTREQEDMRTWYGWKVPVWSWIFDGKIDILRETLDVGIKATHSGEIVRIDQLRFFPLQYASPDVRRQLESRGEMFWTLRHRRFVSYRESKHGELRNVADRFMVDVETYKKLHPLSTLNKMKLRSALTQKEMRRKNPPPDKRLLLFPYSIPGFNLLRKTWVDLYVDYMVPVSWNKQAFADLVVDDETKELVQALVMKQISPENSTDFVGGKGNGLIVLLHGGPGTGKTFTAEGVAEFAEKPLLRVTCGDVGTDAIMVEKNLQSSFHLGKIWDCVVLLDEADVFLEERDMKDLNRNALVSVFLRELEYHEGILILTSNRVGTFDEAFKSRIQLSLHYENLGVSQRRKIWRNFMNRVKSLDTTIDYDDIMDHIDDLSKVEMNGREIRNAITTARQLAQFKEKPLGYSHLNHVLRVNGKFGRYLNDLRDGLTADDLKREGGLRLTYQDARSRNKESPF